MLDEKDVKGSACTWQEYNGQVCGCVAERHVQRTTMFYNATAWGPRISGHMYLNGKKREENGS